jgi:RimJ/RimL family protein N-acetyltransferase
MNEVLVVPTAARYVEGFNTAVDVVARERRYIGFVEGPSVESTRKFVSHILDGAGVQMLAVTLTDVVVGWCDIVRNPNEGFRHVGRLGMGLLPDYRGRGVGKELAVQTIRAARKAGIERVELEVFASNEPAIALYRALGFVTEGIKRRARKLDGEYDDNVFMALFEQDSAGSDKCTSPIST